MADVHHPDTLRNRGDTDAPHTSPVTPSEDARTIMLNKISWGAVLAGVVVALVTQLILNLPQPAAQPADHLRSWHDPEDASGTEINAWERL